MRPARLAITLAIALACVFPAPARAQDYVQVPEAGEPFAGRAAGARHDPTRRPGSAGRLVADYDFEERLSNPLAVPVGWVRGQHDLSVPRDRPGFPTWNAAELDYQSPAFRGEGTVMLPVKGDSASMMLTPGVLSVFAEGDYLASVHVRTRGLVHARAQLVARLLDNALEPIAGAESRSPLITSEGRWTRLEAPITGGRDRAAFLQLELLVLQPEQYDPIPPDAAFRVAREDYDGAAWFDDLTVIAIPRIEIVPDAPAGFAVGPTPPALDMLVRDLAGQAISVEATVTNADGRVVDRIARDMPGGRFVERWSPALPEFGWYRADLTVRAAGAVVGSASSALAWAPATTHDAPAGPAPDTPGFGLVTSACPAPLARELPRLAALVGADAVSVSLWDRNHAPTAGDAVGDRVAPLIDRLLLGQHRVTLTFPGVPAAVASDLNIDPDDVVSFLAADSPAPGLLTDPLLDRYGQRIQRWGLGAPDSASPFAHSALDADLESAAAAIARLVTAPVIDVPWRTDQTLSPALASPGRAATIHAVPGAPPSTHTALAADWAAALARAPKAKSGLAEPPDLTVTLGELDEDVFGVRAAGADLARHAISFWQAFTEGATSQNGASRVTIAALDPWRVVDDRRPRVEPSPALPVWRTLSSRLRGRRVTRTLPVGGGVHAYLLEPPGADAGPAAIAIWADSPRELEMHLGEGELTQIDLFGNTSPVPGASRADPADAPAAVLRVSREPIFVEGVDAPLVRMLASIALTPADLPGDRAEHTLTLGMSNPWPQIIQGALYILEPGGFSDLDTPADRSWKIAPRKVPFTLAPGESLAQTVILAHSPAEEAGAKPLVIDVSFVADRDRGIHRVHRSLEVSLPGVVMDLATRRSPPDEPKPFIAVDASVTNTSASPISFDLLVIAPGQPRMRRHVADLSPGESITRTFAFETGDTGQGARIAVSLERTDGEGRLNRTVLAE